MEPYAILYEDDDILIANKLAPIPVQREKTGDASLQDLLRAELAAREGREPFLEACHRVDRRASGAVLFAKTQKALATIEAAFRGRRVEKRYIACVEREPLPAEGRLEHRLVWDKRRNIVRAAPPLAAPAGEAAAPGREAAASGRARDGAGRPGGAPRSKEAILEYRLAGKSERYFFVEVDLVTGRHHQIRAQLAAIGCPIRGDLKYGARRGTESGLIMLHARSLSLSQPRTGARVEALAPFPESEPLWRALGDSGDE